MEILNSENRIGQTPLRMPDEDRISTLPDSVLQNILAFVTTTEAVRTSILSLRWKNLWKLVPCIDFDSDDFSDVDDLLNFMDKFIALRGKSDLLKFRLHYYMTEQESSPLKPWIDAAVMCKLKHLEIQINFDYGYYRVEMPQSILLCNTLVVLELSWVIVDVPALVSLSSLKTMHLEGDVYADDLAFRTLISGCPILEKLSIARDDPDNVQVMCVNSQKLKWLSIRGLSRHDPNVRIVIDAPHLEHLSLRDQFCEDLVINNLGSSLEAEIDVAFNARYGGELKYAFSKRSIIRRFLVGISSVKSLSFSSITLELLCKYLEFESLPQFHGVIHLKTTFDQHGWEVLPALLVCCPNLKSFVLNCRNESYIPLVPPLPAPQCLSSLKSITLQTHITGDEAELGIIRYFLENAVVLEELNINLQKSISEESAFLKELLTFPRCSPACQIFVG